MRPNNSWLYLAIGLFVLTLVGMSLPWAEALNLSSAQIGVKRFNGWNLNFLFLPVLAAVITLVVPFWKADKRKWLWVAMAFGALSFVIMVIFAVNIFRHADELMLNTVPLFGFWLTLLGVIAVVILAAMSLFGKKVFPAEVPYVRKA